MANEDAGVVWHWWWAEGTEPERYHGPCGSRQEAIDDGTELADGYEEITICEATRMKLLDDHLDADWVIDRFNEQNEDAADPDGDPVIHRATPEQERDLEAVLKAAWVDWRTRHGLGKSWTFGDTRNEEVIKLPAEEEIT
jgi:hypothetical protein